MGKPNLVDCRRKPKLFITREINDPEWAEPYSISLAMLGDPEWGVHADRMELMSRKYIHGGWINDKGGKMPHPLPFYVLDENGGDVEFPMSVDLLYFAIQIEVMQETAGVEDTKERLQWQDVVRMAWGFRNGYRELNALAKDVVDLWKKNTEETDSTSSELTGKDLAAASA